MDQWQMPRLQEQMQPRKDGNEGVSILTQRRKDQLLISSLMHPKASKCIHARPIFCGKEMKVLALSAESIMSPEVTIPSCANQHDASCHERRLKRL
mmetsp:Transcript_114095/g.207535  ORF Transcript_114095/g.207535 Transcript_114095/m.207535 type:complete len:96 (-) Transcript_114095:162-449(-)